LTCESSAHNLHSHLVIGSFYHLEWFSFARLVAALFGSETPREFVVAREFSGRKSVSQELQRVCSGTETPTAQIATVVPLGREVPAIGDHIWPSVFIDVSKLEQTVALNDACRRCVWYDSIPIDSEDPLNDIGTALRIDLLIYGNDYLGGTIAVVVNDDQSNYDREAAVQIEGLAKTDLPDRAAGTDVHKLGLSDQLLRIFGTITDWVV
jgi:hypothetical protein